MVIYKGSETTGRVMHAREITFKVFILWMGPLLAFLTIIAIKLLLAGRYAPPQVFSMLLGTCLGTWGLFLLAMLFIKYRAIQLVTVSITTALFVIVLLFFIGSQGIAFHVMLLVTGYTEAWDAFVLADIIKHSTRADWRVRRLERNEAIAAACIAGLVCSPALLVPSPYYTLPAGQEFTVTSEQGQAYDLLLYYPNPDHINASVCSILKSVNATISFNVVEPDFSPSNPRSTQIANAVRVCNQEGVEVEVWPLFAWDDGAYPSLSEAPRFPALYGAFHDWTVRENITVEYLMWDMEAGFEQASCAPAPAWVDAMGIFGYTGNSQRCAVESAAEWDQAVGILQDVLHQSVVDGHRVRSTTHAGLVWDMFDGDDTLQRNWRLPVWVNDDYQYVSQMLYRGCDGPGNATSAFIYEGVRAAAAVQPEKVAVCLGCINYEPYPDTPSVVSDVHLALAAGARSIRLFQGCSWVFGTGQAPGTDDGIPYTNPPHYLSGLEELLVASRQGGTVTFHPEARLHLQMFVDILIDVFGDFTIP